MSDAGKTKTSFKVLFVDDDPTIRLIGKVALEKSGLIVDEAENGVQAVNRFNENPADFVLLDIIMPEMDGFETCRQIRQHIHGSTIPIFMITSVNDTASIEKAYDAGATDFIIKPVNWTIVIRRIILMLLSELPQISEVQQTNMQILDQSHRSNRLNTLHTELLPEDTIEWLQYIHELDHIVGEVPVYLMVKSFIAETSKIVQSFPLTPTENDMEPIKVLAQSLESKCTVIKADKLQKLSAKLSSSCNENNLDAVKTTIQEIQQVHPAMTDILTNEFTYGTRKTNLMY